MKFLLDNQYFSSVITHTVYPVRRKTGETEEDFIIRKLSTDNTNMSSTTSTDHPEFTKLREKLGAEGYIEIQRSWWNGDTVLKPFQLNHKKFKKDDRFCCAQALAYDMK